jgi:hypothetical protein
MTINEHDAVNKQGRGWKRGGLVATGIGTILMVLACGGSGSTHSQNHADRGNGGGGGVGDILTAGVHFGTELCTKKSGDNCANASTRFANDVPVIYYVNQSKTIPKSGDVYTIKWVAIDVGGAAPPNTVIAELNETVDDGLLLNVSTHYTVSSQLSIPDAGWPVGKYVVDVSHNGKAMDRAPFSVR